MTLWKYKLNEVCNTCIGLIQENLIEFPLQYSLPYILLGISLYIIFSIV